MAKCPIIDCDGEFTITESLDSQGVDGWAQSVSLLEITNQTCQHELTGQQEQQMFNDYEPDYSWMEDEISI